jgi:hypothetical protein
MCWDMFRPPNPPCLTSNPDRDEQQSSSIKKSHAAMSDQEFDMLQEFEIPDFLLNTDTGFLE